MCENDDTQPPGVLVDCRACNATGLVWYTGAVCERCNGTGQQLLK